MGLLVGAGANQNLTAFSIGAAVNLSISQVWFAPSVLSPTDGFCGATPPPSWTIAPGFDGVVPTAGTRVLFAKQTSAKETGIWEVSAGGAALIRPTDFNAGDAAAGAFVFVTGGGLKNDDDGWL